MWEQMLQDGTVWMLLDPDEHPENAARILKVWTPLVKAFKQTARQAFTEKKRPMLTALYCSFGRAHRLVNTLPRSGVEHKSGGQHPLWHAMAFVPSSVVHVIAVKAELAWHEA